MHELPLVFFTVLGQSAVGIFLLAFISYQLKLSDGGQLKRANLLAFVLMAVGLAIGILHLGQIFRAPNMLAGLGRSPMSNEIVLCGAFFALVCGTIFFSYLKKHSGFARVCNVAAILFGLVFVWSIIQVYQLKTVASWDSLHTSLQMWLTVLVGGGACAVLAGVRKTGAIALSIGVVISLIAKPDYIDFVSHTDPMLSSQQTLFWAVQTFCLAVGLLMAVVALVKREGSSALLALCAGAVVIGELSARIAFYNLWAIPM
ncbi:dimethyl sulfoxide reductase anchor subunit family protein [Pragia fontium]|uniref:dimethyl sulfoxide reductase anchor subunit family protein n=1 Tax=Pragia fontium TaxID=82985 RepID=UPI000649EF17|nr:DmsC/YnfH family molybdoenzyme membrane anchor subunit [Pragia fontium]AKJ43201.1 diguanylate cyclase [Pragia fontium]